MISSKTEFKRVETTVERADMERLRAAARRIGCVVLYFPEDQYDFVEKLAKRDSVSPEQWVIDAMNLHARKETPQ